MSFDSLPESASLRWRVLTTADAPALHRFELACSLLDDATHLLDEAGWTEKLRQLAGSDQTIPDSAVAVAVDDEIAAVGWVEGIAGANTERAFLEGRVHPDWRGRGIGSALLSWLEERGRAHLLAIPGDQPKVLRIMFWDRADDAVKLFEQHGFRFQYVEELLGVDLDAGWPDLPLPAGFAVEPWSPENGPAFYAVYRDAFATRTGALNSEAEWTAYWATPDYPDFRPQLSFLVRAGDEPAAFSVCHVYEEPDDAYVAQFGVCQAWRRRGLGAAVLAESLRRYAAAGFGRAMLMVNVDNPNARRLYERAGFRPVRRLTMYRKALAVDG